MFLFIILFLVLSPMRVTVGAGEDAKQSHGRRVVNLKGGPESVIWVVQLSDLHFSVFHPERALDFQKFIGPALSMINPSLVFITGDLTDGKSKDLSVMKQNEYEWMEYQNIVESVVKTSGLGIRNFYDLRGNHDNFGVPTIGGSFDFFSKYSINGCMGRRGKVNSITVQAGSWRYLFVGFDTTMSVGLRGPTNLFGHPTNKLLAEIDVELSQWDNDTITSVAKVAFGHFPISFTAASSSGKKLEDVFFKNSLSAYLCGHLHSRFGKNLKRYHWRAKTCSLSQREVSRNFSVDTPAVEEFWEWEMGDWRKGRTMRILAIDRGLVSFVDINYSAGRPTTIILPTYPLDSRFMTTSSIYNKYKSQTNLAPYDLIRALVFSLSSIRSVMARIYDSRAGFFNVIFETHMKKAEDNSSRGDLYTASWNFKAFEDPSSDRFWLRIEAIDIEGKSTMSEMRPFSISGIRLKLAWTWKEFLVMGCQWDALYYPTFWFSFSLMFSVLLIPKILISKETRSHHDYANKYKALSSNGSIVNRVAWSLAEIYSITPLWFGMLGYLLYLLLFPWLSGEVFTHEGVRGYMTYKGWRVNGFGDGDEKKFIGSPDVMVIVLPHLLFVVFPALLVCVAMAAEGEVWRVGLLMSSFKKDDSPFIRDGSSINYVGSGKASFCSRQQIFRKFLFLACIAIFWKHFMSCRNLMKAYGMNSILQFPGYSLWVPFLLFYAIYRTRKV